MSDDNKTREELLEELRALRAQVQQGEPEANDDQEAAPAPQEGMTRRQALESAAWVAPVILSVSLSGTPAEAQRQPRYKPRGQRSGTPTPSVPTPFPTSFPTASPTMGPTAFPTASPTGFPTASPTPFPTGFPTCSPTNTMCPTPFVPVELQSFKIE